VKERRKKIKKEKRREEKEENSSKRVGQSPSSYLSEKDERKMNESLQ